MKTSKFTETQIVSILKQADAGGPVAAYSVEKLQAARGGPNLIRF